MFTDYLSLFLCSIAARQSKPFHHSSDTIWVHNPGVNSDLAATVDDSDIELSTLQSPKK